MKRFGAGRRGEVVVTLVAGAASLALVIGLGSQADAERREAIRELDSRFAERIGFAASYVDAHLDDVRSRQLHYARVQLSGPDVDAADFDLAATSFGFHAALLLDGRGVVLASSPQKPSLVGTEIASRYSHLASAVGGVEAVSDAVPSAAESEPIVAIAVPFDAPTGRRVISGGYRLANSPLATFLATTSTVRGRELYLVDATGQIIASTEVRRSQALQGQAPELARLPVGTVRVEYRNQDHLVVVAPVNGTRWKLIAAVPVAELHAPVAGRTHSAWALTGAAAAFAVGVVALLARLSRERNRLRHISGTDSLTGLANRASTALAIERVRAASARSGRPWAVAMLDVDRFKSVNDRLGHAGGDVVLRHVAALLSAATRSTDFTGRWGGEEFLIVMEDSDAESARVAGERIADVLRRTPTAGGISVTASIGVASAVGGGYEDLVRRADLALYGAKGRGRDRVVVAASGDAPGQVIPHLDRV